jgi:probable HAF family extracellular repeat protein
VGSANLAGDQSEHAYLWRDGIKTDLGTLGGPNSSEQWPVKDNRGLIAAVGETSNVDPLGENFCGFNTGFTCLGFLWQDGQKTPLPTLGGNNGQALGVNNQGQVVGYAENNIQDPNCVPPQVLDIRAVIWSPKAGEIRQLPPLPGDTISGATGINDREQVVGVSGLCSDLTARGVLWQDGAVVDLGNLGGVLNTVPWAINAQGEIVGQSDVTGDATLHAFFWNKGDGMQDLGTLPGDSASLAFGIDANGRVVGGSCFDATLSSCRAFLWQDGVMTDLNTLVKLGSTPLYLFFGNDINSRGEIAAYAFDQSTGEFHAAVGVPCDAHHADVEGCEEQPTDPVVVPLTSERPKVTLPENIREQLRKRPGFGRFGSTN